MITDEQQEAVGRAIEIMELYDRTRARSWPDRMKHKQQVATLRQLIAVSPPTEQCATTATKDAVLKIAVDRFLRWKMPENFMPDRYIAFNVAEARNDPHGWPTGTNLFTATEAREMFEHCLAGLLAERNKEQP